MQWVILWHFLAQSTSIRAKEVVEDFSWISTHKSTEYTPLSLSRLLDGRPSYNVLLRWANVDRVVEWRVTFARDPECIKYFELDLDGLDRV